MDLCKFIIDNVDDANPVTNDGQTPRDFAERYKLPGYNNAKRYKYRGFKKAELYKHPDYKNQELIQLFPEPKSEPKSEFSIFDYEVQL